MWLETHLHFMKWRSWHLSHLFMANRWGKKWKQCQISVSLSPKSLQMVTAAMKLKDTFSLGRKAMKNPDSVLESRDISLLTKVHIIKAVSFPVVMYRCENWTIKKPEYWRIGAFKLWCWRRLLRVLWKQEDQLILKEIHSEYSLEGLMLKLQYFGHKMGRVDSLEKTWCWERLSLRREEGDRGWESWMASPIQWTWVWANSGR